MHLQYANIKTQRTIGFLKYQRESESDVQLKTELKKFRKSNLMTE